MSYRAHFTYYAFYVWDKLSHLNYFTPSAAQLGAPITAGANDV